MPQGRLSSVGETMKAEVHLACVVRSHFVHFVYRLRCSCYAAAAAEAAAAAPAVVETVSRRYCTLPTLHVAIVGLSSSFSSLAGQEVAEKIL